MKQQASIRSLLLVSACAIMLFATETIAAKKYKIENRYLSRELSTDGDVLKTTRIVNKRTGHKMIPIANDEFKLVLSKGDIMTSDPQTLTSKDFKVRKVIESREKKEGVNTRVIEVQLYQESLKITMSVTYTLNEKEFFARKQIKISSPQTYTLHRIDVESIGFEDAYQPYTIKKIYATGEWKPGLGQPLYTAQSATFWGVEFPASTNTVENNVMHCGYLSGRTIYGGTEFASYKGVFGVADDKDYIDDSFYAYISQIRCRPLRLQVQYNSWFDFGPNVNKSKFAASVRKVHKELTVERGVDPLNAYVIDDGWQDSHDKNLSKLWILNNKFDPGFKSTVTLLDSIHSTLGLWLSPGCNFGARPMVENLRKNGYEALTNTMSLAGPKYMGKLEERILELTRQGTTYFKFDGSFGHLHIRDFELQPGRGVPMLPGFSVPDTLKCNDKSLNSSMYDDQKTLYLVAGSEKMMRLFEGMAAINPSVFIAITNGAYLSPWWLQYVDVLWLINAGDAAGGSTRTEELVYRDNVYYDIWKKENTKFPMNAIFNHEPKKANNIEEPSVFRNYLYMNLSRGTGFIELYLKTVSLESADWDVLAEGLKWSKKIFPTFSNVRMIGGNPGKGEVYGYSGWTDEMGYISLHNPSNEIREYEIVCDRSIGITNKKSEYQPSFRLNSNSSLPDKRYTFGDRVKVTLQPREILLVDFKSEK